LCDATYSLLSDQPGSGIGQSTTFWSETHMLQHISQGLLLDSGFI
jgi:hypothetical protein